MCDIKNTLCNADRVHHVLRPIDIQSSVFRDSYNNNSLWNCSRGAETEESINLRRRAGDITKELRAARTQNEKERLRMELNSIQQTINQIEAVALNSTYGSRVHKSFDNIPEDSFYNNNINLRDRDYHLDNSNRVDDTNHLDNGNRIDNSNNRNHDYLYNGKYDYLYNGKYDYLYDLDNADHLHKRDHHHNIHNLNNKDRLYSREQFRDHSDDLNNRHDTDNLLERNNLGNLSENTSYFENYKNNSSDSSRNINNRYNRLDRYVDEYSEHYLPKHEKYPKYTKTFDLEKHSLELASTGQRRPLYPICKQNSQKKEPNKKSFKSPKKKSSSRQQNSTTEKQKWSPTKIHHKKTSKKYFSEPENPKKHKKISKNKCNKKCSKNKHDKKCHKKKKIQINKLVDVSDNYGRSPSPLADKYNYFKNKKKKHYRKKNKSLSCSSCETFKSNSKSNKKIYNSENVITIDNDIIL